jgi:hypothetical protein
VISGLNVQPTKSTSTISSINKTDHNEERKLSDSLSSGDGEKDEISKEQEKEHILRTHGKMPIDGQTYYLVDGKVCIDITHDIDMQHQSQPRRKKYGV